MGSIVHILTLIIQVLIYAIFASVILSWLPMFGVRVPRYHPVVRVIEQMADLVLAPIRRSIPATAGSVDFSPMIAIIILYIVRSVIVHLS